MKIQRGSLLKAIALGGISVFITACGPQPGGGEVHRAPTSQKEAGILVHGVSSQDFKGFITERPELRYRKVDVKRGLYEIYGLSRQELKAEFPHHKVYQNEFFGLHNYPGVSVPDWKATQWNRTQNTAQLNECKENGKAPDAIISRSSQPKKALYRAVQISLGESIELSSRLSQPDPNIGGALRIGWQITKPLGSIQQKEIHIGKSVSFKPKMAGAHFFLLVVQDKNDVCTGIMLPLIVTDNTPYKENSAESPLPETPALMPHLKKLNAGKAWEHSTGKGTVVAVIDSGVNYNHRDLRTSIWTNSGEIPGNHIDDDKNGWVDDYAGYDFNNQDPYAMDDMGHGSHVSGLLASPYYGIAPQARILPIKALSPLGGDVATTATAIHYALEQGADVINLSLGYYGRPHPLLQKAIDEAEKQGVIVVASAGNGDPQTGVGLDTDKKANYPSALPNNNIIAVAALGRDDFLATYSNFGAQTVDVIAPGGHRPNSLLKSAYISNPMKTQRVGMAGTSMAAPLVTGVVALSLSINPDLDSQNLKPLILESGQKDPRLNGFLVSERILNANQVVEKALRTLEVDFVQY